jgi:hypothetical protein
MVALMEALAIHGGFIAMSPMGFRGGIPSATLQAAESSAADSSFFPLCL